tara:strand:- start:18153 stop:18998 length:846 start_codon:yes stop_codon:yes gene_type:complete
MEPNLSNKIPVVVTGALGKMGQIVTKTVISSSSCELVGAIDSNKDFEGEEIGSLIGLDPQDIFLSSDFEGTLCSVSQQYRDNNKAVMVDFTHPSSVYENTRASIAYGVCPVIGTTGLSNQQIQDLALLSSKSSIGTAIIPNFSIGIVLLQQAASVAARFFENVELIESHHNEKADSPSGTCIKTAEFIEEVSSDFNNKEIDEISLLDGCRGGVRSSGINIHSIRLPGLLAHQEVIFGSKGQTYTLRHDTTDREAYMNGVLLVINKIRNINGLIYGLEKLID